MKQGFIIVERNHWRKWGEIDIIARNLKDKSYHFVEVKTTERGLGKVSGVYDDYSPADNLNYEKKKRLSRIIQTYVEENGLGESDWQIDLALVYMNTKTNRHEIEMLEDIDL